jgi:radical SAM superfamily enzyme YgiQ (UPF0313 family)
LRAERGNPNKEVEKMDYFPMTEIKGISFRIETDIFFAMLDNAEEEFEDSFAWRQVGDLVYISTLDREIIDLSKAPFVYDDLSKFENKIIYYESSRGCPFSCSYCLSSIDKKLRFRDMKLVKQELLHFIENEIPQVKFIDRTFNCDHKRTLEIWQFLIANDRGKTNFHFEVSADLFNEEEFEAMSKMRAGLIQLEIGVQSTNEKTIEAIKRRTDLDKLRNAVKRVKEGNNIHQHLDLIAGLPFEDFKCFAHSFDEVYAMRPDQLQLGFLKVLSGSDMERNKKKYGIVAKAEPPYEVLKTKWISYDDVLRLKGVEEMVEVYYNSGQFANTIKYLEEFYESPFEMYNELGAYYGRQKLGDVKHKRSARYEMIIEFVEGKEQDKNNSHCEQSEAIYIDNMNKKFRHYEQTETVHINEKIRELLTLDYYLRENAKSRPTFAGEYKVSARDLREFFEKEVEEKNYLKEGYGHYDTKQLVKMTHVEKFEQLGKTILFDYLNRDPLSHNAQIYEIQWNGVLTM